MAKKKYDRTASRQRNLFRNRYIRAAERAFRESERASGAERGRLRTVAKNALERAVGTYEKAPTGKKIKGLAGKLGVSTARETREKFSKYSTDYASRNYTVKQGAKERIAMDVISSGNLWGRVMGGLVDVWKTSEGPVTREAVRERIFDFLDVDNWADALRVLEEITPNLYEDMTSDTKYDEVTSALMAYVAEHQNA